MQEIEDLEDFKMEINQRIQFPTLLNTSSNLSSNLTTSSIQQPPALVKDLGHQDPALIKIYVKTWGCSHNNSDGE